MGRQKTNYAKHGYFHDLMDMKPALAMLHFCKRRSGDIIKDFGHSLTHDELIARIYYQGLKDGEQIYSAPPKNRRVFRTKESQSISHHITG